MAAETTVLADTKHDPAASPPPYVQARGDSKPLPPMPAGAPASTIDDGEDSDDSMAADADSFPALFTSIPAGADLNSTAPVPKEIAVPAVFLGIPFPAPESFSGARTDAKHARKRPALLLYAPPRAPYHKPTPEKEVVVDEKGKEKEKKAKQKIVKRVERKWQEEVAQGQRIHEGKEPDAGRWKRGKGALARKAGQFIQWLPDTTLEALTRIPPKKKLHEAVVLVPEDPEYSTPEQQAALERQFAAERKGAIVRTVVSGLLLPVTEAIDFFNPVPVFLFEINLAYFSFQVQGLRKATALHSDSVSLKLEPAHGLAPLQTKLAALCEERARDKKKHKPDESTSTSDTDVERTSRESGEGRAPDRTLAEAVAAAFRAAVPPEVAARHALEDMDLLAEDVERCLRKGAREYVKAL